MKEASYFEFIMMDGGSPSVSRLGVYIFISAKRKHKSFSERPE